MALERTDDEFHQATTRDGAQPEEPYIFYNETVIDHFTNPRNVGEIDGADGYALMGDPSCGDQMKLWIKVTAGCIVDIKFFYCGCQAAGVEDEFSSDTATQNVQVTDSTFQRTP